MRKGINRKIRISINISAILVLMMSVFLVTKVIRTFSGNVEDIGGVWNLIQIAFVVIGVVWWLKYYPFFRKTIPISILLFLDIYIFVLSIPHINMSVSGIFSYGMLLYAASIFLIFFMVGSKRDINDCAFLYYTFYLITIIVIIRMSSFWSKGAKVTFYKLIDVADVYYSLGLLPLAFIYVKKYFRFVPILLVALALILTGKRAGILALIGMILCLYLLNTKEENIRDSIKKIIILLVIGMAIYYCLLYFDDLFHLKLIARLENMGEDGGSGRITRWIRTWDAIKGSNMFTIMFGHGWKSVSDLLGGHAHNDFMEILYEFGLFAAALYVSFYISLIVKLRQMMRSHYRYAPEFAASLVCSLFVSNFSFYFIKPSYITCGMLCFGFFLADFKKCTNPEESKYVNS